MPTATTAAAPDKAAALEQVQGAAGPGTAIVFFVTQDAATRVCVVFVGAAQEVNSRAFALQWLATHYGIARSGEEERDWERVLARYDEDGEIYYTLQTVIPRA